MLKDPQTPRYTVRRTHRTYSPQLKAQLVAMSQQPGASIAALALAHDINSSVVHRWRKECLLQGLHQLEPGHDAVVAAPHGPAFVSVPLPALSTAQASAAVPSHEKVLGSVLRPVLELRLQRGELQATLQCSLADCTALLREVLR